MLSEIRIELMDWASARKDAERIRRAVFVLEQGVPLELEMDQWDAPGVHALAFHSGSEQPVGTARLLPDGHIGRMAVLPGWRRRGVGRALLEALLQAATSRGHREAVVNAQTYVTGFYARAGFAITSAEFADAGIPHVEMRRTLTGPLTAAHAGTPRR